MSNTQFFSTLQAEVKRIDDAHTAKRNEKVIEGFTNEASPKAIIQGKEYRVFNSNDYLGLRFNQEVRKAEHEASLKYGAGPGAVRFISGTMKVHKDLEAALAKFHNQDDAMIFSSAFAVNVAVISCLIKGQSKDSLVKPDVLVVSDALNHRSIIEGIRVANLPSEQKKIYKHLDFQDLDKVLNENLGKYKRVVVLTDGVFSMLGEYTDLKALKEVTDKYEKQYEEGVLLVVDDSHGAGAFGEHGRGAEEASGVQADVLVGTLGKAFGTDGGYVVANQQIIDYLRESSATYIYSNPISPGVAGAALKSVELVSSEGAKYMQTLKNHISYLKEAMHKAGLTMAAESIHPIQPVLIGDPGKTKQLVGELFNRGILATAISYPVVPPGKDEIRVQLSASHTQEDLDYFIKNLTEGAKQLGII